MFSRPGPSSQVTMSGSGGRRTAGAGVEAGDAVIWLSVSSKSKMSMFSRHPLGAYRLRDDDDIALGQPAQDHLGNRPAMCRADLAEGGVGEQVVLALGERAPRLDLHAVLAHQFLVGMALEERVGLDLVHRRGDVVVVDQVDQPVGVEVRHADRLGEALAVRFCIDAPGAVVVAKRLVNEVQVDVVKTEALEGSVEVRAWRLSSPVCWIHILVVMNNSSRGMPLSAIARPTASSLP